MLKNRCSCCSGRQLKRIYKNRKLFGYFCNNCKKNVLTHEDEITPVEKVNIKKSAIANNSKVIVR